MCTFIFMFWPPSANTRFGANPLDITWSDTADKICGCPEKSAGDGESPNTDQFGGGALLLLVGVAAVVVIAVGLFVATRGDKSKDFEKQTEDVEIPESRS